MKWTPIDQKESTVMATPQPSAAQEPLHTQAKPLIGVLLVHGLNGSRSDFREIETRLRARGMVVVNMLLPGHGSRVRDLVGTGWDDWAKAVTSELNALKQRCDVVFLVGHSLGGALSLHIATHEEIAGIVSICAPLYLRPWLVRAVGIAKYIVPLLPVVREDVRDRQGRIQSRRENYRWMAMRPIESLVQYLPKLREELPRVSAPALIMISVHDHVVPARDGREIYHRIGSQEKHLVTFHRSYHVVMRDHDREELYDKTLAFILRHAGKAQPHMKGASSQTA
jgi:carboxylesterase